MSPPIANATVSAMLAWLSISGLVSRCKHCGIGKFLGGRLAKRSALKSSFPNRFDNCHRKVPVHAFLQQRSRDFQARRPSIGENIKLAGFWRRYEAYPGAGPVSAAHKRRRRGSPYWKAVELHGGQGGLNALGNAQSAVCAHRRPGAQRRSPCARASFLGLASQPCRSRHRPGKSGAAHRPACRSVAAG